MKNMVGLIVPVLMLLFGAYALMATLGSSGEQIVLLSDHQIPRGWGMVFGLLGLGGGTITLLTAVSNRKLRQSGPRTVER
jgi:hypothetical protein